MKSSFAFAGRQTKQLQLPSSMQVFLFIPVCKTVSLHSLFKETLSISATFALVRVSLPAAWCGPQKHTTGPQAGHQCAQFFSFSQLHWQEPEAPVQLREEDCSFHTGAIISSYTSQLQEFTLICSETQRIARVRQVVSALLQTEFIGHQDSCLLCDLKS